MMANDLEARRRAEAILTEIGEPALDALNKAATSKDVETRRRAEQVIAPARRYPVSSRRAGTQSRSPDAPIPDYSPQRAQRARRARIKTESNTQRRVMAMTPE